MKSYRTDLSRARGLGAAGHGAAHWISERVSAIALAPLSLWAVFATLRLARADHASAAQWVSQPINAVLLVLTLAISCWHMHAGMRVIVEDYIHKALSKSGLLILNLFVCVLAGSLSIFAILKVAFGGGAY